jgi:hypothetical protein
VPARSGRTEGGPAWDCARPFGARRMGSLRDDYSIDPSTALRMTAPSLRMTGAGVDVVDGGRRVGGGEGVGGDPH